MQQIETLKTEPLAAETNSEVAGFLHPSYAKSLAEFGEPTLLPRSRGWFLKRPVPGFQYWDGLGCYPLLSCHDWTQLGADLNDVGSELVCLSAVIDPFGKHDEALLRRCFPDITVRFKESLITDLAMPARTIVSKHHRYYARKALERVDVEICEGNASQHLDEWVELYDCLIQRHQLRGLKAFSRSAFATQLAVPGTTLFRARRQGATVGAHLWYVQGNVAYSHRAAYTSAGYEMMAGYALYWRAIEHFQHRAVRWLDIGGGAGAANVQDGLTEFKHGWATGTKPLYFCGRIFDRDAYDQIARAKGHLATEYFPAYRKGEFD